MTAIWKLYIRSGVIFVFLAMTTTALFAESAKGPNSDNTQVDVSDILAGIVASIDDVNARLGDVEKNISTTTIASPATGNELSTADKIKADVELKHSFYRFIEIIIVALVGILSLVVILHYIVKSRVKITADGKQIVDGPPVDPKEIMNVAGLTIIVFGTILVVMMADSEQQLTASVGILGALAGYLFRGVHDKGADAPEKEGAN
jgi:hypothetical protein